MMLTLWLFAITEGIGSARKIVRLTTRDLLTAGSYRPAYNVQAVAGYGEGGPVPSSRSRSPM
jgi:hypothetical protein